MDREFDIAIVGGGIAGSAIGYGLAKAGRRVVIVDGSDHGLRASRTNHGLIWIQGKGANCPPYQRVTRLSSRLWPSFAAELQDLTGIDLEYRPSGGLNFCVSEAQFEAQRALAERMVGSHPDYEVEICERSRLENMLPGIRLGPKVCGASFSPMDGHVNPLLTLRALLDGFVRSGGTLVTGEMVSAITPADGAYRLTTNSRAIAAERVVLAAGNESTELAASLDLPLTLVPQRGQLLVTERVEPVFPFAASGLRQNATGTFQLGFTNENVGRSVDVTLSGGNSIANRALNIMPDLGKLRVVRHWAGLRVLTPDGVPIYDRSRTHPGVFVAACHSAVTLAAFHAGPLADWLSDGGPVGHYQDFSGSRFDVGATA